MQNNIFEKDKLHERFVSENLKFRAKKLVF